MTDRDNALFGHTEMIFRRNFRITQLYAAYLDNCPELITSEMIELLTEDGSLTVKEAIVAILAEAFGLDVDNGAEDRALIKDYLTPSVRILDPKKYTEDPYYKNIRISDLKDGAWEYRLETYPAYRGVICNDIEIYEDMKEVPPLGFFAEEFHFPAVLEDGNEWMTLTPVDLDTCEEAIAAARGKVVTFGLGLGYYAYMCQRKPEVESITVVEKSPDIIRLFKEHILPQFEHPEKVRLVEADAFDYAEGVMPSEGFDIAFVDTWRDASDGAPMYRRMKALEHLSPNTSFYYWIENFLISRCRAERYGAAKDIIELGLGRNFSSYEELIGFIKNV
ncbi:MAG: hypothetical protein IKC32_06410 [Clostridia bacterium]|nr:hypothetical protein [Clostridia bacterium]